MCKEIWIKANLLTFLGLAMAVIGILLCFIDQTFVASVLLMLVGICDGFDGFFAKKFRKEYQNPEYGIQLDSLCDIVGAGIFPVIICLSMGFTEWYAFIIYIFFIMCGITRLAYYNVNSSDKKYFNGLPITCSAFIIPFIYFITKQELLFLITLLCLSILYVLKIKIPKPNAKIKTIFSIIMLFLIIIVCILFIRGILI